MNRVFFLSLSQSSFTSAHLHYNNRLHSVADSSLSSPICTRQPCVGYWSVHYVLWEQNSSQVASFACSGFLFQMWMCCKGGHYRGFFVYAHYRSAQTSFIGAWGGGSNKMRCQIGFRRCRIRIRLVPAQIKPCLYVYHIKPFYYRKHWKCIAQVIGAAFIVSRVFIFEAFITIHFNRIEKVNIFGN